MPFSDYEIIHMGGKGMQLSALTADQRKLASRVRRLSNTPREDLSDKDKKLMDRVADEHVTPAQIHTYTGISTQLINNRVKGYRKEGIDPRSLVFKASRGFYAKSRATGSELVLHSRSDQNEGLFMFGLPGNIEETIREKRLCVSPGTSGCTAENSVRVTIPLKYGVERTNMSQAEFEAL